MLKDIATNVDPNFYDETLSETSGNAVQNQVITKALNKKADKTELSKKQDVISDLSEIRNKAKFALQSVPSEYITEAELNIKNFATKSDVALVNTSLSNTNSKFVDYYTKDQANVKFQPKGNYLTEHQDISGKQDKITDLAQIRSNAQKGATALQAVPAEYATKTDVSKEVSKIVNSAPEAFNTLKEIADWIEEDAEPAIVLANKVENKVDKVAGKGLSANDYTTAEKNKLAGLQNYDDSKIRTSLEKVETQVESQDILIEDLQDRKANEEGYYPLLYVGLSDNLPDRGDVTEGFIGFRESAGAGNSIEDGTANVKELLGNSVVWNQLFYNGDFSIGNMSWFVMNNNSFTVDDGVATIKLESEPQQNYWAYITMDPPVNYQQKRIVGHRYLLMCSVWLPKTSDFTVSSSGLTFITSSTFNSVPANTWVTCGAIAEAMEERKVTFAAYPSQKTSGYVAGDIWKIKGYKAIDLTKMFGAGNEPTTIEEFYARIPQNIDLNAYNEGEVIGVNAKGFKSVNDNAWDEEWELGRISTQTGELLSDASYIRSRNFFRVVGGSEYYISGVTKADDLYVMVCYYDTNMKFINHQASYLPSSNNHANYHNPQIAPKNAAYAKFFINKSYGTTYNNDICVRLAHSGYKTDYVAHEEAYSSFDLTPYFPNGMHGINGVRDSATPSEAIRRFGAVDLGSVAVVYGSTNKIFILPVEGMKLPVTYDDRKSGILCSRYTTSNDVATASMLDKSMLRFPDGNVYIKDSSFTDAASFKAAMSGVLLYYELAEPIVTKVDPQFNFNYKVWDFGTEQMICDTPSANVITRTIYGFNATDTIRGNKAKNEEQDERLRTLEREVVRKDDYQPDLSVGLADNLSGVDVVDSEVNFRRSGGGAISDGVARIEAIKGNSVVWNQLSKNAASYAKDWHFDGAYEEQVRVTYDSDKHLLALAGKDNATSLVVKLVLNIPTNHKVLVSYGVELKTNVERNGAPFLGYFGSPTQWLTYGIDISSVTNKEYRVEKIMSLTSDVKHIFIGLYGGSVSPSYVAEDKMNIYSPLIIDLTKMFGAGNEPTTIEEFYARKPMGVDLNAYNEGEVIHCDVQSIESQGVNAWDGSLFKGYVNDNTGAILRPDLSNTKCTGFVRVLPNMGYYIGTEATIGRWGAWYDKDKNYISGFGGVGPHKSPSNAAYMRMTIAYNDGNPDTFCINLSDTSINGKYFPYVKRTEDLSIIRKYFPQGMKKAGSAHDEIRYNKVTQKWEMVQRIGEYELGEIKFYKDSSKDFYKIEAPITIKEGDNYLCANYSNILSSELGTIVGINIIPSGRGTTHIRISDLAYTDVTLFNTAVKGIKIYYELAEPIVTELDAEDQFKDLDYQVWNCGTEKAIAEGKSAPLAADITYGFNAIGKIKELESLVAALRAKVGI